MFSSSILKPMPRLCVSTNMIFKDSANAKYSIKDLKGGHHSIKFSLMNIYLDEKRPSVKIQLLNIFKDNHIVAQTSPTAAGYDE